MAAMAAIPARLVALIEESPLGLGVAEGDAAEGDAAAADEEAAGAAAMFPSTLLY